MRGTENSAIASYLDWWSGTGVVEPVQDDAGSWLQSVMPASDAMPLAPVRAIPVVSAPILAPSRVAEAALPPFQACSLPSDLDGFDTWLSNDPDLPGAAWSARRILPTGPVAAPIMVIADMPDMEDFAAGRLLAGPVGELFDAMLAAINHSRTNLRVSSIAFTRPAGGRWDNASAAALKTITLHHIALAKPQHILLLGQLTCRLLTDTDVPADGEGLRNINHYGVTTAATAIHHPRVLLKQAALKRGAWTALKSLREPA